MNLIRFSDNVNGRIRYSVLGLKGFIAKRKYKSRGFGIEKQKNFTQLHLGRLSVAIEKRKGRKIYW